MAEGASLLRRPFLTPTLIGAPAKRPNEAHGGVQINQYGAVTPPSTNRAERHILSGLIRPVVDGTTTERPTRRFPPSPETAGRR